MSDQTPGQGPGGPARRSDADPGATRSYRPPTARDATSAAPQDDRAARVRQARSVLSGSEVRPPSRLSSSYVADDSWLTAPQLTYLISLVALLVIALLIWLIFSLGAASVVFFLLALTLLAGWLIF